MKAGIIAAGQGDRLIQGGILVPKPLVTIGGEPLIARAIRAATHVGVTSIACIVNDLNPAVADYLRSTSWPVPLELIVKTTPSSMESLFSLAPLLSDEPFLLFTVDAVFEFNVLRRFLTKARRRSGDGVLAVTRFVDDEKPLWARLDKDQKIVALGEEARPGRYVTAGFYYFRPEIFSMIDAARIKGLNALRQFLDLLLKNNYSLYGVPVSMTVDVDTPQDIEKAHKYLEEVGEGCGT
jgi:NDP-sugar pyrophosphorylase family protein